MKEDMRGLFYIVKGQYRKDKDPDGVSVSGYDPTSPGTPEWYQLKDRICFHTLACGSDLNKVVHGVYTQIKKWKTAERYFKHVCSVTSDDYYQLHYKGQKPLTPEQRSKRAEGRCPRVSPPMKVLEGKIYECFGDYYSDLVEEMEDLAYTELKGQTPFKKSTKLVKKTKSLVAPEMETPTPPKSLVKSTPPTHKVLTPVQKKRSFKKLSLQ